jgi:hypothetical protein
VRLGGTGSGGASIVYLISSVSSELFDITTRIVRANVGSRTSGKGNEDVSCTYTLRKVALRSVDEVGTRA